MEKIILASSSPRRQELLSQIGIKFQVVVSGVEEVFAPQADPRSVVEGLAKRKAEQVAQDIAEGYVIGADTIVVIEDNILGKPVDLEDAVRMLSILSGKTHQVMTGVCIIQAETGKTVSAVEITDVTVKELSAKEITDYVATGEPIGKAGAYAIQGKAAIFVERINGCFSNVVGLPLFRLREMLSLFGIDPFSWSDEHGTIKN